MTAIQDGINMAICLKTLRSGFDTYCVVWQALADCYSPFYLPEFEHEYHQELHK